MVFISLLLYGISYSDSGGSPTRTPVNLYLGPSFTVTLNVLFATAYTVTLKTSDVLVSTTPTVMAFEVTEKLFKSSSYRASGSVARRRLKIAHCLFYTLVIS